MQADQVITGDCRDVLPRLIAAGVRVQTCITSPPYYGLRDYGLPGQIGLEQTMQDYLAALLQVFRLVHDLLVDDGTLWLNLGDSYSTGFNRGGLPPKNLMGIPWRLALALQNDGWFLRQDIIWHKSNPLPESVTDRCTRAHEYLFLLSKHERYYFNHDAIRRRASLAKRMLTAGRASPAHRARTPRCVFLGTTTASIAVTVRIPGQPHCVTGAASGVLPIFPAGMATSLRSHRDWSRPASLLVAVPAIASLIRSVAAVPWRQKQLDWGVAGSALSWTNDMPICIRRARYSRDWRCRNVG